MSVTDRIPPQALDVERVVLGSCLSSVRCLEAALDHCKPEDFYSTAHRKIFTAISELNRRGVAVDIVSAAEQLRKSGALEQAGADVALAELCEFIAAPESIKHHAGTLREKATLRGAIEAGTVLVDSAFRPDAVPSEIIARTEQALLDLSVQKAESRFYCPGEILGDVFADADRAARGELPGITTGFNMLDKSVGGLEPGQLIIIAGRPSMGKTSLALQVAANISGRGRHISFFSIEMSKKELTQRLLCHAAEIDLGELRTGRLSKAAYAKLATYAGLVHELLIHIDDSSPQTVGSILSKARQLKRHIGLDLLIVDHLGLISNERGQKSDTRNNDLSAITRGLKLAAKTLHVPVVLLCQLNRDVERRTDHRPMLSDLRESGAIEQDADVVMFIYRDEVYEPTEENHGQAEIIIGKQRNGPVGKLRLYFKDYCAKFCEEAGF